MSSKLAKIYKIECLITGRVYIGSTTQQYLSRRLTVHRAGRRSGTCSSSLVMENDNYTYSLIEQVPLEDRYDRERFFILNTLNCVNKMVPRSKDFDAVQANRDSVARYYYAHREEMKQKKKNYYHEVVKPRRSAAAGAQPSSSGAGAQPSSSGAQPSCSCSGAGAQPSSSGVQPSCSCSGAGAQPSRSGAQPSCSRSRRRSLGKIVEGVNGLDVLLPSTAVEEHLADGVARAPAE